jgi:predicted phage tail protein
MTSGGDGVESETAIGQELIYNQPETRQIINANLDIIRVRLAVLLEYYKEDGSILGNWVEFKIEVKQGSGAWEERVKQSY